MDKKTKIQLLEYLSNCISDERKEKIESIVNHRTRYITVVLEDIFQAQNASAVIRTSECFGVQDIHIIENENEYNINPDVVLGSSQWINMYRYNKNPNNTLEALTKLKNQGYKIVATTPHKNDCTISEIDISQPIAFLFGTELNGLSDIAINNADQFVKIPMVGFTESFNISVSVALVIQKTIERVKQSNVKWELSEDEIIDIKLEWVRKTLKTPEMIEKRFFKTSSI